MSACAKASLRLYCTPKHVIVLSTQLQSAAAGTASQLVIDASTQLCRNSNNFNPFDYGIRNSEIKVYDAFGFLGMVHVEKFSFLAIVTQVRVAGVLGEHVIYQVVKTNLIPLQGYELTEESRRLADSILKKQHELSTGSFLHDHAESKYYWNKKLYKDLALQGADHKWFLPVIQGYVKVQRLEWGPDEMLYALISRRSCNRAGTRYNARGVDDDGEVANFVETEQIVVTEGTWFGLVMVRGTVPVFWQQTGLAARFEITRSKELTAPAFMKSVSSLIATYQRVLFINLLSNRKPHERVLSEALKDQMKLHENRLEETLSYYAFDYKAETKAGFDCAAQLIEQVSPMLLCYLYFSMNSKKMLTLQKGVARINCLDCLDRTNIVMSRVAWFMLSWQFMSLGKRFDVTFDSEESYPALTAFKGIWAENGDALSLQYTGAGSTATIATKKGKSGLIGFIDHSVKSLERFYSATYDDWNKQDGIDMLLGKHLFAVPKSASAQALNRQVTLRAQEFIENSSLRVRVCSWNVRGERPPQSDLLLNVIFDSASEPPHIIAIGLQDLVLVNPTNVFLSTKNFAIIEAWRQLIAVAFTRHVQAKYLLLKTDLQVGLLTLIYVLESIALNITNIEVDKVKLGLGTAFGGKGAIVIRFNMDQTSFCFCNAHLLGTATENVTRLAQLEAIEAQAFQTETVGKRKGYRISSHDVSILFGDLNFKIGSGDFEVYRFCKEKNMAMLLANDQLLSVMGSRKSPMLSIYKEGEINFLPTVNRAELTKPDPDYQQSLSWTDRILYSGKGVRLESYGPLEVHLSSHLPICANFTVQVQRVDEETKAKIEREESANHIQIGSFSEAETPRKPINLGF